MIWRYIICERFKCKDIKDVPVPIRTCNPLISQLNTQNNRKNKNSRLCYLFATFFENHKKRANQLTANLLLFLKFSGRGERI